MAILVTGSAGFIGFHVAKKLLERGDEVIGIDNFNDYYDPKLKEARNKILEKSGKYKIYRVDIADLESLKKVFEAHKITKIMHLAAQAGVRYCLKNAFAYGHSNLIGTLNLLELAKNNNITNFVFASSSSVYGKNEYFPSREDAHVDSPISLYAATKRADELMAHVYSHIYNLNITCLRFFNAYGPFMRPDMALYIFTKNISEDKEIPVFHNGETEKDYTYIDDIAKGAVSALDKELGFEIINLGNGRPVKLLYYIKLIEKYLGKKAKINFQPLPPGDVPKSCADVNKAKELLNYDPETSVEEGIKRFVEWYGGFYNVN